MPMNTDKAYLLGLVIGGGVFGNAEDVFRIRLPYKKWGSYLDNPQRAGEIAGDILRKVKPMFNEIYHLSIEYETSRSGNWSILCEGDLTTLKDDLEYYEIICEGELCTNVDISKVVADLVDDNLKRRFIAGLADTIGSMARSQRRFDKDHQILSFEIKGCNFDFVCGLCRLLYSVNCIPDQVNWNHPNIHCSGNPYYSKWNKGFKLRILLDQYAQFGAFAFRTKAESSNENRSLQQQINIAKRCEDRKISISRKSVHPAENDNRLPEHIRGGHYIHFRHFCAVLGCEHAPFNEITSHFSSLESLITPFPIQCRDNLSRIEDIVNNDPLLAQRVYEISNINVLSLLSHFENKGIFRLYGTTDMNGYPITEVLKSIAYIIAEDDELYGKRPKGYVEVIKKHTSRNSTLCVEFRKPDLLTPLIITGNERGALIGADNPSVYAKLISFDPVNKYKISVRQITEEDLFDAK